MPSTLFGGLGGGGAARGLLFALEDGVEDIFCLLCNYKKVCD